MDGGGPRERRKAGEELTTSWLLRAGGDCVTLTAVFEPAEGGWVQARLLEWRGVIMAGRTREEARALLRDAAREWLRSLDTCRAEPRAPHADYETLELEVR